MAGLGGKQIRADANRKEKRSVYYRFNLKDVLVDGILENDPFTSLYKNV